MQVEFELFLTLYHYVAGKPLMVQCKGILGIYVWVKKEVVEGYPGEQRKNW